MIQGAFIKSQMKIQSYLLVGVGSDREQVSCVLDGCGESPVSMLQSNVTLYKASSLGAGLAPLRHMTERRRKTHAHVQDDIIAHPLSTIAA